ISRPGSPGRGDVRLTRSPTFGCGAVCARVCQHGLPGVEFGFWFLVLDPLHVFLSLAFIVRALEKQSRHDRTCMLESNQSKHG
ncbi:unnamed protein product, partial [Prunus brigantina]